MICFTGNLSGMLLYIIHKCITSTLNLYQKIINIDLKKSLQQIKFVKHMLLLGLIDVL